MIYFVLVNFVIFTVLSKDFIYIYDWLLMTDGYIKCFHFVFFPRNPFGLPRQVPTAFSTVFSTSCSFLGTPSGFLVKCRQLLVQIHLICSTFCVDDWWLMTDDWWLITDGWWLSVPYCMWVSKILLEYILSSFLWVSNILLKYIISCLYG